MGDLFGQQGDAMMRRATISEDNRYRYRLTRIWEPSKPPLSFVMLNPSTADDRVDDPTIRRCIGFAKREGCGGLIVGNLYGFRATDPDQIGRVFDPYGPKNTEALLAILDEAAIYERPVVCAWGARGTIAALPYHGTKARLVCLGRTKDGHPRHPLYVKADQPLEAYAP